MADISDHDFQRLINEVQKIGSGLSKLTTQTVEADKNSSKSFDDLIKNFKPDQKDKNQSKEKSDNDSTKAARRYRQDKTAEALRKTTQSVSDKFNLLGGSTDVALTSFKKFAETLLGGAIGGVVIGGITEWATNLLQTYRNMTEIGQNFSGGIVDMAKTARESGVSISEFARMMKQNSVTAAQIGNKGGGLAMFAKGVRDASEQFGMYGFTVESLNNMSGQYMDTLRLAGKTLRGDDAKAQAGVLAIAAQTTALSNLYGKSREEIMKTTNDLLSDGALSSKLSELTQDGITKATLALAGFAAQSGSAGKMLSKMLADTITIGGPSLNSETGKLFGEKGLGRIPIMMADFADQIKDLSPADQITAQNEFAKKVQGEFKNNDGLIKSLRLLAVNGDSGAKAILDFYNNLKVYAPEELETRRKAQEVQDRLTKSMLNFNNVWGRITGTFTASLLEKLQKPLESLGATFEEWNSNGKLESFMTEFAKGIASFIQGMIEFGEHGGFKEIGDVLVGFYNVVKPIVLAFASFFTDKDIISGQKSYSENIGSSTASLIKWGIEITAGIWILGKLVGAVTTVISAVQGLGWAFGIARGLFTAGSVASTATEIGATGAGLGIGAIAGGIGIGGAALSGLSATQLAGMDPEKRKGLYADPMIGAMGGDLSLGAAIFDATNTPKTTTSNPTDAANRKLSELNDKLAKQTAELTKNGEYNTTNPQTAELIEQMKAVNNAIKEQTEILARQNNEQLNVAKRGNNLVGQGNEQRGN